MNILDAKYFKMTNAIFYYGLTPIQLAVYSYLVCCAGQKGKCWPSMGTIAHATGCSKSGARMAVDQLVRQGFIRKVAAFKTRNGRNYQTNNTYYILDLPDLPKHPESITFIEDEKKAG